MRKKVWVMLSLLGGILFSFIFMTIVGERIQQGEAESERPQEYERYLTIFDETLGDIIMNLDILIESEEAQELQFTFAELDNQLIRLDERLMSFNRIKNEIDYFPTFKELGYMTRGYYVSEEGQYSVRPVIYQGQKQLTTNDIEFLELVKSDFKNLSEAISKNGTVDDSISPNEFNRTLKELLNKDYITIYATEFSES